MKSALPAAALALVVAGGPALLAQWPRHPTPGVAKTADGKPNLTAPAPRTADGKPDLSGVWETVPCIDCADRNRGSSGAGALPAVEGRGAGNAAPAPQGRGAGTAPPAPQGRGAAGAPPAGRGGGGAFLFGNIGGQLPEGAPPYQPWAAELVKKRVADNSKDNPDAHCLPMGIMQLTTHPFPRKIIQTPSEVVIIYEGSGTTVREIFLDGRQPDKDADPWWNGYSTGRWEGDTLVVDTTGFMDDGWLDVRGSPLTSAGKVTERFRRVNFGYLEIQVTIADPKAYTKPFTATVSNRIMLDTQLIEFVCIDKDAGHYVGGSTPAPAAAPPQTPGGRGQAAVAPPAATRPALMFKEDWRLPPHQGAATDENMRFTPAVVGNERLEAKVYGSGASFVRAAEHEGRIDLWTGLATSPVAVTLKDKRNYMDLTGLARLRWTVRTTAIHTLYPVARLADGTYIAGNQGITTDGEFLAAEISFGNMRWFTLDPMKVVVTAEVKNPDLSRVDEVGLVTLAPGGGHGIAGSANLSTVELYAKPVPR